MIRSALISIAASFLPIASVCAQDLQGADRQEGAGLIGPGADTAGGGLAQQPVTTFQELQKPIQLNERVEVTDSNGVRTRIERRTKLVSLISGAGRGRITGTYAIDPEHHRRTVTLQMENQLGSQAKMIHRVYDAQSL